MLNTPFAPWPSFTAEESAAAANVLLSNRVNYWTGDECRKFEKEFSIWCGVSHAVSLANGTLALDLALNALGIGPGDDVIVTPRTFIASVSSVVLAGARPIFADVNRESGNIDAATIAAVLTPQTRAIIVVHIAGWPCDMDEIMALAVKHEIKVIEDCAQAHGAKIDDQAVGSIGHIGAWSFCQDKIMTTGGEGGMVTTNDPELWSKMWSFKDHGKSWDAVYNRLHNPGFRWLHESFGTNWRMLEIQAAIGRIQLESMRDWTCTRRVNAHRIIEALVDYPAAVRVPLASETLTHAYYKLYAYIRPEGLKAGWNRDKIIAKFVSLEVPVFQGTCSEVYLEKAFNGTGWRPEERLPIARELGETSIMFLVHPTLTNDDIIKTIAAVNAVFDQAAV